ncbi:Putative tyrosine-protein kinase YveL [Halioglobus japonicus]|nr:Putative tyrosine-protein kinase YveL [Halioglobus japonicus]
MSIIEKAVSALGKGKASEPEKDSKTGSDVEVSASDPTNTVQKAASNPVTPSIPGSGASPEVAARKQDAVTGEAEESAISYDPDVENMVKIPFMELRELGMLTPAVPRSAIAEEYRTIKRPLLTNIAGDSVTPPIPHGNLIMVTSALEGDGKTFSSICLALSIAMEREKHVLFVDADTAKAEAGRQLGVPSTSPGLIDVLEDENAKVEDFILPTNVEKLRILPAGGLHTHANELLASARMHKLMLALSDEDPNRVIVFDSPPLLLTTEAAVLASFMGQIVFVVSSDSTPQYAVTQAIEHIGEEKMVGMILNRARKRTNPYSYYTYEYRGGPYGYGHRDGESAPGAGQ